jgi:hypothetical protein
MTNNVYPMPLLPPVTSAVAPARFHRSALLMDAATIFFLSESLDLYNVLQIGIRVIADGFRVQMGWMRCCSTSVQKVFIVI